MDIIRFKGGLGNQMFQYALLKALSAQKRNVMGSLGAYQGNVQRSFCLRDVFANVSFNIVDEEIFNQINEQWKQVKQKQEKLKIFLDDYSNRFFWVEDSVGTYNKHIFETHNCTFVGYWQTEKYFVQIRKELLWNFHFPDGESQLQNIKSILLDNDNYVSVHIRRGDYLDLSQVYGNICTEQYYKSAMRLIGERIGNPVFVFFSDDIGWVKEQYKLTNAIYIEPDMFEHYCAWYDMCLMSLCSHNIIANSSFSWWGAWLNQRNDKIVIAPKSWINGYEMPDVCPDHWIRLGG